MTDKKAVNEDGEASDLNNELDSLLATSQDYLSSQKEGRFAPCNPDFLIKNLAEEAKRLQEYEKRLLWLAGFIALADDELIALGIQSDKDKIALLVDALKDARSALLYVREVHGELYGVGFDRVEKKASAALFTVAASESNTGLHAGVKSLREKLKQEANYLQLKDWHKLSRFERQTVKKLENLGFLEKKVADGFVGRSI